MTSEKQIEGKFEAMLLDEFEYNGVEYKLFSNRIFYVTVPRLRKVQMDVIEEGYKFLNRNEGGRFFNIYSFDSFSDVEPEVREWAADKEGNLYTHSDAIVIGSLSQKIITDFYLRVNKPIKPTRIFYSLEKAIGWTLERVEENK